jgi:hypothetical protein
VLGVRVDELFWLEGEAHGSPDPARRA